LDACLPQSDAEAEAEAALDGAAQVEELRKQLDAVSAALHASQSSHHQEVLAFFLQYSESTSFSLKQWILVFIPLSSRSSFHSMTPSFLAGGITAGVALRSAHKCRTEPALSSFASIAGGTLH
jgi:hypothetical protein